MIRLAHLNHYDLLSEIFSELIEQHKKEVTNWKDTRFILGPHWELN
jgi:hypothetical protein